MDSTKKTVITLLTFLAVFELTESKWLCEFAEMFPGKASENCFQRKGTKEDKDTQNGNQEESQRHLFIPSTETSTFLGDTFTPPCVDDTHDLHCTCNNSTRTDEPRSCHCRYNPDVNHCIPNDCYQLKLGGIEESGVYLIQTLSERSMIVSCDMETDGGGWTVFQRRIDGSVDFNRGWTDYKEGFGTTREFWLGNENLHQLTQQTTYTLYIALSSSTDRHAKYNNFTISEERGNYQLVSLGEFSGSPGETDSMRCHESKAFTTHDNDNDLKKNGNCGKVTQSGWWFNGGSAQLPCVNGNCQDINLNEPYTVHGIVWNIYDILTFTEMKIRP